MSVDPILIDCHMPFNFTNMLQNTEQIMSFDGFQVPGSVTVETVTHIHHWSDTVFSLKVTRPQAFRFRSGEFIMLGLPGDNGRPLLRAYSMASPAWDEEVEFYSIKVQDGPLTSKLQHIKEGDPILLGKKPTGTLVLDALKPGKRLYFFSTGTGFAPFASLLREPETYEKFEEVVCTHTGRFNSDLLYSTSIFDMLKDDPLIGEMVDGRVRPYQTTTREDSPFMGRITHLIENGKLFKDLGIEPLNPETDRVMICGSTAMLNDTKAIVEERGFIEGSNAAPGDFVIEKAFVS